MKENNQNTNQKQSSVWEKPYRRLSHPKKKIVDKAVSYVFEKAFPLKDVSEHPPCSTSDTLESLRQKLDKEASKSLKKERDKWHLHCGEHGLYTGTIRIPRKDDILQDWSIVQEPKPVPQNSENNDFVAVHIQCPASVVAYRNEGDVEIDFEFSKIDSAVPIVLWFHGGGMVLRCLNGNDISYARSLSQLQEKNLKSESQKDEDFSNAAPIILASVEYRLAPEHPFPAGIIDCLSTLSFLIETSSCPIHVSGQSAGGYLATVTTFEGFRRYPGRIKSAFIQDPMLQPMADSMSYYLNSLSSGVCPTSFVRWCWRAYLQLDNHDHDHEIKKDKKVKNLSKKLRDPLDMTLHGSNRGAIERSNLTKNKAVWRLCCPHTDIPSHIDDEETAPKFVIVTSKADPLHDDGIELVSNLNSSGASVTHIDAKGSHVVSLLFDKDAKDSVIESWRCAIWS